jgi:hypothetical protein
VFDGAAKFRGLCINDHIQNGPTVMNESVAVVHRFRQYDYAVTGDVKEMFLQVRVPPEEKDYLRFLWYEEGEVVIYRYTVHLFGKCDSLCVSMAAIFLQALTHKEKFPQAFETMAKASLVDDMADSRPTRLEITELVDQLIAFFPLCALEIRKFVGNSLELMQNLKTELRIKDLQATDDLKDIFSGKCPPSKVKVIGLLWDYVADTIGFDFSNVEPAKIPITKMNMLVVLHTLYDPM